MNLKINKEPSLSNRDWTVVGAAGWILWHLIAMLAIAFGIASVSGEPFSLSKALLPAAMFSVAYLVLSLVIVPGSSYRSWLFGLWFVASSVGLAAIYLVLDKTGQNLPAAVFAFAAATVAFAALIPYLGWISRLSIFVVLTIIGAAATLFGPAIRMDGQIETATISSALYPLTLRRYQNLVVPPAADGGALVVLPDGLLLAGGDGVFQWLAGTGGLEERIALHTDIPAPMDRTAYLADFDDPASAPRLRLTDAIFAPGNRPDRLYAAHQAWDGDDRCYTMRLSQIALEWTSDGMPVSAGEWRTLFDAEPCQTPTGLFDDSETGGRLDWDMDGNLLITLGDLGFSGLDGGDQYAQIETENSYGKIWRVDPESGFATLVSIGHRNPQGIVVARDGRIWESEHGPQGGDEINIVRQGGNYGWPLVTYGTKYGSTGWPLNPEGVDDQNFDEPVLSFVPSIATSALIEVTGPMFERWDGDLLLASLRTQAIFRLRIQGDSIVYSEPIPLGERLRDIAELPDGQIVAWVDSGMLLELSVSSGNIAFNRFCVGCHAPQFGAAAGPSLSDIAGRNIASLPEFDYSVALQGVEGTWAAENLDAFLRDPAAFAPGTTMLDPGMSDVERDEVLRFLLGDP